MPPLRFALVALALVAFLAMGARDARADPPGPRAYPVYVLALDTDDAEDQADALTTALRSRVRTAQGWSLSETTVTLSMLTAALKCPRIPDAPCLARIADQLKGDRFIWGHMQKAPGNRVKVDLHLWSRNKAEQQAGDTYADNLKDFTDDRLLRIAQRLFDRLAGIVSTGALILRAGDANGAVFVDGQRHGTLTNGEVSLELPAGSHTVELRAQGYAPASDTVTIVAGRETRATVNLVPSDGARSGGSGGPAGRKVAGWAAVGVGAALLIAAGVEAVIWANQKKDGEDYANAAAPPPAPAGQKNKDTWVDDPCSGVNASNPLARAACDKNDKAVRTSTVAWIFGGTGVAAVVIGTYLLATDGGASAEKGPKFEDRGGRAKLRLVPSLSPSSQGVLLSGTF